MSLERTLLLATSLYDAGLASLTDTAHGATPREWALHAGREAVATLLERA